MAFYHSKLQVEFDSPRLLLDNDTSSKPPYTPLHPKMILASLCHEALIFPFPQWFYSSFPPLHFVVEYTQRSIAYPNQYLHKIFETHWSCIHHLYHFSTLSFYIYFAFQQNFEIF